MRDLTIDDPARALAAPATALRRAIVLTLVYADLFDYPLTRSEVQRYLIGQAATLTGVAAVLEADPWLRPYVDRTEHWFHLKGRHELADVRRERAAVSARLWPAARAYASAIARLPFVRLVAVTGALAVNNARPDDDIDLFILVQPGRLWLCRLLVLGIVKLAARHGTELCPNFLLSTDHLPLSERNLFTAHEVAQLVPIAGGSWYRAFATANQWTRTYLPNALPHPWLTEATTGAGWPIRVSGEILSSRAFSPIERWEMQRKIRRLRGRLQREGGSGAFSAQECRGHFAGHEARILAAFGARAAAYAPLWP